MEPRCEALDDPAIAKEIRALAVRMASENEGWGYTRIVGELLNLGHRVSRSTVRRILKDSGIGPAPERVPHMPWSKFLKAHWEALAAADFFTIEVWTKIGLVRYAASRVPVQTQASYVATGFAFTLQRVQYHLDKLVSLTGDPERARWGARALNLRRVHRE